MGVNKTSAAGTEEIKSNRRLDEDKKRANLHFTGPQIEETTENKLSHLRFSRLNNKV